MKGRRLVDAVVWLGEGHARAVEPRSTARPPTSVTYEERLRRARRRNGRWIIVAVFVAGSVAVGRWIESAVVDRVNRRFIAGTSATRDGPMRPIDPAHADPRIEPQPDRGPKH